MASFKIVVLAQNRFCFEGGCTSAHLVQRFKENNFHIKKDATRINLIAPLLMIVRIVDLNFSVVNRFFEKITRNFLTNGIHKIALIRKKRRIEKNVKLLLTSVQKPFKMAVR